MNHSSLWLRAAAIIFAVVLAMSGMFILSGKKTSAAEKKTKLIGVDVSDWNGKIDWERAKNGGVDFAIIRVCWGDNTYSQDDGHAAYNMEQCEKYDIPYGVYVYSYALSQASVDQEVAHIIRVTNGHKPALGYWFDMEDADAYKLNHDLNPYTNGKTLTNFCLRFLKVMKEKGYSNVGVYANPDYFYHVLDYNKIKEEGMIWLAHWGVSSPALPCEMWQYSAEGVIAGGSGVFDMNIIYSDSYLYPYATGGASGQFQRVSGMALSFGDINGDGNVNASDLRLLKSNLLSLTGYDESFHAGDINLDGTVDLIDLAQMKKQIVQRGETNEVKKNAATVNEKAEPEPEDAKPETEEDGTDAAADPETDPEAKLQADEEQQEEQTPQEPETVLTEGQTDEAEPETEEDLS